MSDHSTSQTDSSAESPDNTATDGASQQDRLRADIDGKLTPSRRTVIGGLLTLGGIAAFTSREQIEQLLSDVDRPTSQSSSTQTTPTDTLTPPPEQEQAVREQQHNQESPFTPTFEYDAVSTSTDSQQLRIRHIAAAADQSGAGDQVLITGESGFGTDIVDLFVATWTPNASGGQAYEITLGDAPVEFTIRSGTRVTLATAVDGDADTQSEAVYLVRAVDDATARTLIDNYPEFYRDTR